MNFTKCSQCIFAKVTGEKTQPDGSIVNALCMREKPSVMNKDISFTDTVPKKDFISKRPSVCTTDDTCGCGDGQATE